MHKITGQSILIYWSFSELINKFQIIQSLHDYKKRIMNCRLQVLWDICLKKLLSTDNFTTLIGTWWLCSRNRRVLDRQDNQNQIVLLAMFTKLCNLKISCLHVKWEEISNDSFSGWSSWRIKKYSRSLLQNRRNLLKWGNREITGNGI